MVSLATPSPVVVEHRLSDYFSGQSEMMRLWLMLDLDQSRQKTDGVTLTELVWESDDLFDDEWLNFNEPKKCDPWNEVMQDKVVVL